MALFDSYEGGKSAHAKDAKFGAKDAKEGVPWRTVCAVGTAVGVLVGAHFYRDRSKGFDPVLLRETVRLHWPKAPAPVTPGMPLNGVQQLTKPAAQAPGAAPQVSAYFADDSLALDPFYAALWTLEQGAAALPQPTTPDVVTILHYGDSPTTADLITGDARALLQARFGNAGAGFNLAAKPWAWYAHRHIDIVDSGWDSSQSSATGVGRMRQGHYGLGGAVFTGVEGAKTTYTLTGALPTAVDVQFLAGPDGGTFTVATGGTVIATVTTRALAGAAAQTIALPANTRQVKIEVTSGTVQMFGVDFKHGTRGVIYDSLGLNGATTTVVSRTFDPVLWSEELHHTQPSLIILNYGTNESQFGGLVTTLDKELRLAIDRVRAAAPGVPILIMSPMDRGKGSASSGITTMPEIPQIVAIQQKVAAEEHVSFFNTYAAMGGDGTMSRWYAAKPRLVTADFIHPTPQGASVVAGKLVDNLMAGYDRWKRLHGIAIAPPAASAPEAPPRVATQPAAPARAIAKPAEKK